MPKKISAVVIIIVLAIGGFWLLHRNSPTNNGSTNSSNNSTSSPGGFNKTQNSLTDPASIWVVVNKQHSLNPKDYSPSDLTVPNVPLRVPGNESMQLRKVTAAALQQMFEGAKAEGLNLMLASGYRSYVYQVGLYNGYVKSLGQSSADQQSARPGYSEHQTGFAVDIEPSSKNCELEQCFGDTPEGKWLATNAYLYGFIVRYTAGNQGITGYEPEPWHIRYIGTSLSTEMHSSGVQTLEQFFGVSGGTVYN